MTLSQTQRPVTIMIRKTILVRNLSTQGAEVIQTDSDPSGTAKGVVWTGKKRILKAAVSNFHDKYSTIIHYFQTTIDIQ